MTSRRSPHVRRSLIGTALLTVAATSISSSATALVAPADGSVTRPATVAAAAAAGSARTSAQEARRVDGVPTPNLVWDECPGDDRMLCSTVRLPLDYDDPKGPTVELVVLKLPALKPKQKIGSLFVNPGGPGGSVTGLVSEGVFGRDLENKFDIIGLEPRAVGVSEKVQCWKTFRDQNAAEKLSDLAAPFPESAKEFAGAAAYTKRFSKACSTNVPLAGAASTAEYARDLDVMRRVVGDKKLSFFGFSYGTVVGQTYAALFPDRVRALVLDGVADAVRWTGTPEIANQPSTGRILSGEGAYAAFVELMKRCDAAGPKKCVWSDGKSSLAKWKRFAAAIKAKPLTVVGSKPLTYSGLTSQVGQALYDREAGLNTLVVNLQNLYVLERQRGRATASVKTRAAAASRSLRALAAAGVGTRPRTARADMRSNPLVGGTGAGFAYIDAGEAYNAVWCTDALNPTPMSTWLKDVAATERKAPYFGQPWLWSSLACAREAWTVQDEDVYRGPFNIRPASPMLVVGNTLDPATNYKNAIAVAKRTRGSALLLSDSWGHTAFGTSACVTSAITTYLVTQKTPPKGTRCVGDFQPFADPALAAAKQRAARSAGLGRIAPVVGLAPLQLP